MWYLRKYLQQVGLVSTLLIGGVLGGLLAPLPSDALPATVTLKVDNGTPVSILSTTNTSSTCTATEVTLGYTHCYAINTSAVAIGAGAPINRNYRVQNAPGATARLRVADLAGQDKFSLIGVQFVPTLLNWGTGPNHSEQHVLTITKTNTFNSAGTVGNYVWVMRAGGEFRAGPTTPGACPETQNDRCDTIGNKVVYPGKGTFSPTLSQVNILRPAGSPSNTQPLSLTVAGPAVPIVSFNGLTNTTLGQVNPTYPSFICDNNGTTAGGACTPAITETMTVTLKGPDSFVLVNGQDVFGAHCTLAEASDRQERKIAFLTNLVRFLNWLEQRHPNPRLSAFIDRIEAFLATINSPADDPPNCSAGVRNLNVAVATAAALDQIAFEASGALAVEPESTGTITINKNVCTGESCTGLSPVQFTFSIYPGDNPPIVTNVTTDGTGHGTTVVSVPAGAYNVVESPQSGWNLTQASCGGGNTNGVNVLVGDNVTCNFTNSPATGNDLGIRLTWGAQPSDLDSHLYIPNGDEVAWFAQGSLVASPYVDLDLDDVNGFGPENITVVRRMEGTYQYFVHNFSETFSPGMTGSPARVELIRNGVTTTYVPPEGEGTNHYWHVFNVIVNEACAVSIVLKNEWLASPPTPIIGSEVPCDSN